MAAVRKLTKNEIFARHVRMARAALGMGQQEFGRLVGLSGNTISKIEKAGDMLLSTLISVETKLGFIPGLTWMRDDGKSIGIRLNYDRLPTSFPEGEKIHAYRQGRGRRHISDEWERGSISYDIERSRYNKIYAERKYEREMEKIEKEKNSGRGEIDRRVSRPKGNSDDPETV
jgi:DNA-binding XRE family transcriptional regulator